MCGIAGYFSKSSGVNADTCQRMTDQLYHRGPDDHGVWIDQDVGITLGHRRLSIQDLSSLGHQPMVSSSGRFVIAFNGEIYNFLALGEELAGLGARLRGHSDTEVILAAIEEWGLDKTVTRLVGMFAFAVWDSIERILCLVRDRIGEKPLYYGWQGSTFLFASELKALRCHPNWIGDINRDALALFMRHNYIPAPYSIAKGIHKLLPGSMVRIPTTTEVGHLPGCYSYWDAKQVAEAGTRHQIPGSDDEAVHALDELLKSTIRDKMISDVPLGAFLSGGYDSSLVTALMQAESDSPVKTFTIGFYEDEYNEATYAKQVAKHLGTEHHELYITPQQAMDVIPRLPQLYDEPFADSSQIPTFLVSQITKEHVTVALSGDGGDELFGGYTRYFLGESIWKKITRVPGARYAGARMIKTLSPQQWDTIFKFLKPILPGKLRQQLPGDKLHKLAGILGLSSPELMYLHLVSHWKDPASVVIDSHEPPTALTNKDRWADLPEFVQRMQFLDMISYLPDDILVKVDRAAMGVSLETRVPFLDHRIVEFASRVPLSMKIRDGKGKWLLRQVLYKYVPKKLLDRPKMGFGIPIDNWLRGPQRDWAESLINRGRLSSEGYFDPDPIRNKWEEHISGTRNWHYYIWNVLMFQSWLDNQKPCH
jgi:asparagine synthase (glutamine-hydrolysing)